MQIVHVDPGYGKLMGHNDYLECVENTTYNPYSDFAFSSTQATYARFPNLDLSFDPPSSAQIYKKVWSIKLSSYGTSAGNMNVGFSRTETSNVSTIGISISSNAFTWQTYDGDQQKNIIMSKVGFSSSGFHNMSVTLSLTADKTQGATQYIRTITLILDNFTHFSTHTFTGDLTLPEACIVHFNVNRQIYISNILVGQASYEGDGTGSIPSDDGIPADTPIYRLPLDTPITDFTAGDNGEYIGTANGQTLLQAVNAATLITTHGNRPVNHIVAYGAPGYRVGSAVSSATGISKSDGTITSHGTHTLSFDKTAHVYDVWKIGDGNTFSDINGLQVGWRAGE